MLLQKGVKRCRNRAKTGMKQDIHENEKRRLCMQELERLFYRTGDPVYLNFYCALRDENKPRRR